MNASRPAIGISWSATQAQELDLNPLQALETCLQWPLEYVRLGVYWDQVEKSPGKFDFSSVVPYLNLCKQYEKKVVLTVGVKAPRWPEFYFPPHVSPELSSNVTQQKILNLISSSVTALREHKCISVWQVENEPLDPSGPDNSRIPLELLQQEVQTVRALDHQRPILLTLWGNDLKRGSLPRLTPFSDIVGLDLYYKQYMTTILGKNIYRGPDHSSLALEKVIRNTPIPVWITELQAEPWENDTAGYRSQQPGSMNLSQLQANWNAALQLPVEAVFFWGVEYWLWQESQGNSDYVRWITSL